MKNYNIIEEHLCILVCILMALNELEYETIKEKIEETKSKKDFYFVTKKII